MSDSRIFVSYSRADKPQVLDLVRRIESETGARCWIDLTGIESGSQFEDIIIKAIGQSEIFLLFVSDSFLQSQWTKREVYYAESEGKRIVPISVDGRPLRGWVSFHFGPIDYIDATSPDQVTKLCADIRSWLGDGPQTEGTDSMMPVPLLSVGKPPMEKKKGRWLVSVLSTLIIVVAGLLLSKFLGDRSTSDSAIVAQALSVAIPEADSAVTQSPEPAPARTPERNRAETPSPSPVVAQPREAAPPRTPAPEPAPARTQSAQAPSSPSESVPAESPSAVPVQIPTPSASTHGVSNGHSWVDLGTGLGVGGRALGPGARRQDGGWGGSSWLGWARLRCWLGWTGALESWWALDSEHGVGCEL